MNKLIFIAEISRCEAIGYSPNRDSWSRIADDRTSDIENTTTRWERIAREERQRSLILDETAIHYLPRRLLCNFNRLYILYLGVGHCGRRIMLSAFQESAEQQRAGGETDHKSRTEKRASEGSRRGSARIYNKALVHFPCFPWTSNWLTKLHLVSSTPRKIGINSTILSFYPSRVPVFFPRLIDRSISRGSCCLPPSPAPHNEIPSDR